MGFVCFVIEVMDVCVTVPTVTEPDATLPSLSSPVRINIVIYTGNTMVS